jgi:hypothetical protein
MIKDMGLAVDLAMFECSFPGITIVPRQERVFPPRMMESEIGPTEVRVVGVVGLRLVMGLTYNYTGLRLGTGFMYLP